MLEALNKLLEGYAITLHEARLLEKYYGKDIGRAAHGRVPMGERAWMAIIEALNIPRTSMASMDMSGILRQGRMLLQANPEFTREFIEKYATTFASEKVAKDLEIMYKNHPDYKRYKEWGIEIVEWGGVEANIAHLSEEFAAARLLQKIPGIRASERSFVTALNWLRLMNIDKIATAVERARGREMTLQEGRHLARAINNLSGRASLPKGLEQLSPLLNAFFFSPRFMFSRLAPLVNLPMAALRSVGEIKYLPSGETKIEPSGGIPLGKGRSLHPRLEMQPELKLQIKAAASMAATTAGILGLIAWVAGDDENLEIELNPLSTNFGKGKWKNMRFDYTAGYGTAIRFLARFITGKMKNSAGEIVDIDREDAFKTFLETKESPIAGLISNWWGGEDMVGRPFGQPPKDGSGKMFKWKGGGVAYEVYSRLTPLVAQAAIEAFLIEGVPEAVGMGTFEFFGGGGQTYEPTSYATSKQLKNDLAEKEEEGKGWDDLKPSQQAKLRRDNPEIAESETQARKDKWPIRNLSLEKQQEVGQRIRDSLSGPNRKLLEDHAVPTTIARRIYGNFWLNAERYKTYEKLATAAIDERVAKLRGNAKFKEAPRASQEKLLREHVTKAKEFARKQLKVQLEKGN